MRIVSLLGSATEIVHLLGLGDRLVGISHECDHPPEALQLPRLSRPRFEPSGLTSAELDAAVRRSMEEFGSVYEIDTELLRRLDPDLVLTQAVCEVCAVPTGSVEAAVASLGSRVQVVSLDAHSLEGILSTIRQVADAAGESGWGGRAVETLRARADAVRNRVHGDPRPRAVLLEWLAPPFAPGHWVPEMVELAGGENLLGEPRARSVEVEWDAVAGLDPEVLLVEPCGFDLDQASQDADRADRRLREVAPRAIARGEAWLLHSAWFSRSGPRVIEGIEALARILHPTRFEDPPDPRIARRWSPADV